MTYYGYIYIIMIYIIQKGFKEMESKRDGDRAPYGPNGKKAVIKVILALVFAVVSIVGAILLAILINDVTGCKLSCIEYLCRCIISVAAFIFLGGIAWLRFDKEAIKKTWKFVWPLVLINVVLGVLIASTAFLSKDSNGISIDGLKQIPYNTLLMVLVGINEEAIFRGLLLGGLLLWFGRKKNGMLWAAVISSVVFGFVHVMFDLDFSSISTIATGLMKTLETTMFAIVWCYCVLEYKNLIGAMTAHAFFDWIVVVGSLLSGSGFSADYVTDDPKRAVIQCVFFGLTALLYLPRTIKAVKGIKALELTGGPFAE